MSAAAPTFPAVNGTQPCNVYGRATALLQLLYWAGLLPECHAYGKDDGETDRDMLFINGEPAGKTEAEVTDFIWRMRACYAANGYLFDCEEVVA